MLATQNLDQADLGWVPNIIHVSGSCCTGVPQGRSDAEVQKQANFPGNDCTRPFSGPRWFLVWRERCGWPMRSLRLKALQGLEFRGTRSALRRWLFVSFGRKPKPKPDTGQERGVRADIRERPAVPKTPRSSDIHFDVVGRCSATSARDEPINEAPLDRGHSVGDHLQEIALGSRTPRPRDGNGTSRQPHKTIQLLAQNLCNALSCNWT